MTKSKTKEIRFSEPKATWLNALRSLPRGVQICLKQMTACLVGLLLSSLQLPSDSAPFGACMLAALPNSVLLSCGTGAALGYLLTLDSVTGLRYIAAVLSIGVLKKLIESFETVRAVRLLPSCIASVMLLLTGSAVLAADGFTMHSTLLVLGEAAVAFAVTYFFAQAHDVVHGLLSGKRPQIFALPGLLCTLDFLLLTFADWTVFSLAPARIAAVYLLFAAAALYAEAGGAIAGLCAGIIFCLDAAMGMQAIAFAVGGLLSGLCTRHKPFFCVGLTLAGMCAALYGTGESYGTVYLCLDAVLGALLFLATPKRLRQAAHRWVRPAPDTPSATVVQKQVARARLREAANAMQSVSATIKKAAVLLDLPPHPPFETHVTAAKEQVCRTCGRWAYCWEQHPQQTRRAFVQLEAPLRKNQPLQADKLSASLQNRCTHLGDLCAALERSAIRTGEQQLAQMHVRELRHANADRLDGMVDFLEALAEEVDSSACTAPELEARVQAHVQHCFSLAAKKVSCVYTPTGHLQLTLQLEATDILPDRADLREALETVTDCALEWPVVQTDAAGVQTLRYCARTAYRVQVAAAQIVADREKQSGDSYESFYDGYGSYYMVLSDGMGQGLRAALDSTLTVSMLSTLLKAGVQPPSALKMVNTALMFQSDTESLATVDLVQLDLYTGAAVLYKAGAAKSLLRRKNQCVELQKPAMPIGILRAPQVAHVRGKLQADDLLVLASDGAFDYAESAFRSAVETADLSRDLADLTAQFAKAAKKKNHTGKSDDITVLSLQVRNNTE